MDRLFFGGSVAVLVATLILTGCGQPNAPQTVAQLTGDPVPPGESKPAPKGYPENPGEKPKDTPLPDGTDPDTLPVLPTLTAPTGQEKYDDAIARAFGLIAEKKDREALEAFREAMAVNETDFVKGEIERVESRLSILDAAEKTADDIQEILDAGRSAEAAKLAGDALAQYGDTDVGERLGKLKRQADALVSAQLEAGARKRQFLDEAEAARKGNNYRAALMSYDQALANGSDVSEVKDTYDTIRVKVAKYDESRVRAAELRRDPSKIEDAIDQLKVAAENWNTQQVKSEIADAEVALNNRRDRVAVADFEVINDIGVPRAGHAIAEELLGNFRPRFDVVERSQVQSILEEMKIPSTSLYEDEAGRAEVGRIARARYMVLGSVSQIGGIHVNARLVDTKTGLIVQTAKIVAANPEEMTNRLPTLARMLQMNDDEKRAYEEQLAKQARPVQPPAPAAEIPAAPQVPQAEAPPPAPIVVYSARPPVYGEVVYQDFNGFTVVQVGAPAPPPVVIIDGPALYRDRAFFVAVEVGDNHFRRGQFRAALRNYEFALALAPGNFDVRLRIDRCLPFCPAPVVVLPAPIRPRMVILPFAEFRDPFRFPSSISPGLGIWTADALAPYFASGYDIVDRGELFWWMGRLGMSMRDVLTNPHARLTLGRALGARYFLMGALREIASFDVSTHVIDAELNCQTTGARIRVNNANELRFRLGELTNLTLMPQAQQVVVVQQQQVVQQQVVAARLELGRGKFRVSIELFKQVLVTNPNHVEARQLLVQAEFRDRQAIMEAQRQQAWQQQQAAIQANRDRQIALAAASEATRINARQNALTQQALAQQQLLAQQNLIAQAQLAQRQNNLEQRVALLESANGLRPNNEVSTELAQAKAQLAAERQRRIAAERELALEKARPQRQQDAVRIQGLLATGQQQRLTAQEEKAKQDATRIQAEYDRFVDLGQQAMTAQKYAAAATSFQNARRLKPSPEIEKLVAAAQVEQARADATRKGDAEKKKLEAQLVLEEQRRKAAEAEAAQLRVKYDAALAKARSAMKERRFDDAASSFKLASLSLKTDEATNGLRQAEDELAKVKAAADAEAKKKQAEQLRLTAMEKKRTEGKTALAAKKFELAIAAYKAAIAIAPEDVDLQKELALAEQARDEAQATARKAKEEQERKSALAKLLASGQTNLKAKQYDAAIVAFGDALKLEPSNTTAKTGLEQAQAMQKQTVTDAAGMAEAKRKQTAYQQFMQKGQTALRLKQLDAALEAFTNAQKTLPGDATSAQLIQDVTKQKGDSTAAMLAKQKATELAQTVAAARSAIKLSKLEDAQAATDKAVKLDADNAEVRKLLGELDSAKKLAAAAMQKKELTAKSNAKIAELLTAARKAIAAKDAATATNLLAEATAEDAKDAVRDPAVAAVQKELADLKQSMANLDSAMKAKQAAYTSAMKLANAALLAKQYDAAARQATDALRHLPGDPAATKLLADANKGALDAKSTAMEAQKKQEAYQLALRDATVALTAKKYDVAIAEAKEALALKPNDPTATKILADATKAKEAAGSQAMEAQKKQEAYQLALRDATVALTAKKYDVAIAEAKEALALKPNDPTATKILADALKAKEAAGSAVMEAEKKKQAYDVAMKTGRAAMAVKDYDDAAKAFGDALKAIPADPTATASLKQAQAGLAEMAGNAERKKGYDAWMARGAEMVKVRKLPEAAEAYTNALKFIPNDPTATKALAEVKAAMTPPKDPPVTTPKPKDPMPMPKPKVDPAAARVAELMKAADDQEDAGDYVKAWQTYQDVLKLAPTNAEAKKRSSFCLFMEQGKKALAAGKFPDAQTNFDQALKIIPTDAAAKKLLQQAKDKKKN